MKHTYETHTQASYSFQVRLYLGLYVLYIEEWLKIFEQQRFHILRLEEYKQNKTRELCRIYQFLGLGK